MVSGKALGHRVLSTQDERAERFLRQARSLSVDAGSVQTFSMSAAQRVHDWIVQAFQETRQHFASGYAGEPERLMRLAMSVGPHPASRKVRLWLRIRQRMRSTRVNRCYLRQLHWLGNTALETCGVREGQEFNFGNRTSGSIADS